MLLVQRSVTFPVIQDCKKGVLCAKLGAPSFVTIVSIKLMKILQVFVNLLYGVFVYFHFNSLNQNLNIS